nr:zinc finger, CCHC-type [Tanacetum cinerariifolium]
MSGKDDTYKIKEIGSTTHLQCPMLKGTNYTTWAIRMQIILEANGLSEMIEPNEKTQADNKKDKTGIAFLYQALPEEQLLQIAKHKNTKAIWDALKARHIGEKRVQQARLQTLKSDFEILHMKEDETIDTFTTKLTTLVNKAAGLGIELFGLMWKVLDFEEEKSDESEDYSDNNSIGKKNWVESKEGEIIPESLQNDAFIDNIAESEPINGDSHKNKFGNKNGKILWGNMLFNFATSSAHGRSGGILCVWDKLLYHKKRTYAIEHCLYVEGNGLPDDLTKRANLFRDLKDIDHKDSIDLAQKAKIKWAIEGDENSKKFHGIVNKKIRHIYIKGILVAGEWIENANRVKSEFYSCYSNLFLAPEWDQSLFDVNFPWSLNSDQVFDLEDTVSNEEIKRAV